AHVHTGRVMPHRNVDEVVQLRKIDNRREICLNLLLLQAENGAVEIDVLPAGEVLMEARTQLQQRADATAHRNPTLGGSQNSGDELQRRALAATVAADDAQALAPVKVEAEVAHCPKLM